MESADLDMGEIFDDHDIDEDMGATGVLPDLEPTQPQDDEEENAEVLARLKDLSKGAAKKVVRKPQPKLDPTRLTGERGIPILPNLFKDVKFKGKGHESHDLAILMKKMEHWAHRLFPKMPFDEVIERVEKLGSKKEVQTCIKKIRLDMPVLNEDFVGSDHEVDDNDIIRQADDEPGTNAHDEVRGEDMWDELLREEAEISESQVETVSSNSTHLTSSHDKDVTTETPATPGQSIKTKHEGMTPEILERIERNKQLALERRLKKMGHLTPVSKVGCSQIPTLTPTKLTTNDSTCKPEQDNSYRDGYSENNTPPEISSEQVSQVRGSNVDTKKSDDCNEMSEVIEKGPSQNISVGRGVKDDAQHWYTGSPAQSDSGIQLNTENMDTERTDSVDKCSKFVPMSEDTENQNIGNCSQGSSQNSIESQAMSEIIEPVENDKIVLKEKPNNMIGGVIGKQITKQLDMILSGDKLDINSKTDKENTVKDKLDMTGDHCLTKQDHFDDELTEEQLMDTLEN